MNVFVVTYDIGEWDSVETVIDSVWTSKDLAEVRNKRNKSAGLCVNAVQEFVLQGDD